MTIPWNEQYRHPQWQRKRLEVMEAHGFRCERCGADEVTLNVHHKRYVRDRKVWEYAVDELECLCERCHKQTHDWRDKFARLLESLPHYSPETLLAFVTAFFSEDHGLDPHEENEIRTMDEFAFHLGTLAAMVYSSVDDSATILEIQDVIVKRLGAEQPSRVRRLEAYTDLLRGPDHP